jgi:hypothetical protein
MFPEERGTQDRVVPIDIRDIEIDGALSIGPNSIGTHVP